MSEWIIEKKKRSSWVISYREIKAFLLVFPFIQVHAFDMGSLYDIAIGLASLYMIVLLLRKRVILKKQYILVLLFGAWLTFSCLLNGRSLFSPIFYTLKLFSFTQILEYYIQRKDYTFFYVIRKYMTYCILVTTVFQFIKQGLFGILEVSGNYNNFSFSDNQLGYYYISFIALCIVMDRMEGKKIKKETICVIGVCTLSLLKAWSAKSIVGIALIIFYVMYLYGKRIAKVINCWFVFASYVFLEIGIVVFNIQERFSYLLEVVLHKDATLTGRAGVWNNAIANIIKSPIYGYGVTNGGVIRMSTTAYGHTALSSHNLCLEILMQTGFVGLSIWLFFLFSCLYKQKTEKERYIYYMLLFFVYVILIMQISSAGIYFSFMYLPIILCMNVDNLYTKDR